MNATQLKNSILQEAIEGRLVPQDPNDKTSGTGTSYMMDGHCSQKRQPLCAIVKKVDKGRGRGAAP